MQSLPVLTQIGAGPERPKGFGGQAGSQLHAEGVWSATSDGLVEIGTNAVLNCIRGIALTKNLPFAGHHRAVKVWGILSSLIEMSV